MTRLRGTTGTHALLLATMACSGSIGRMDGKADDATGQGGQGGKAGVPGSRGGGAGPGDPNAPAERAGAWATRRLTRDELDHTLRDLLGDQTRPARQFPADGHGRHGFAEPTPVGEVVVQRLLDGSVDLAAAALTNLGEAATCANGAVDACVARFIEEFGQRAFRRPLLDDEKAAFVAYDAEVATTLKYGYQDRVRMLVRAFLQSPQLLYHGPMPGQGSATADGDAALGPYEIASRLSYFLWHSMPDEALFAAARSGALSSVGEIEAQARRLLADPRAIEAVAEFELEWLSLEKLETLSKDDKAYPLFTDEVRAAIEQERTSFIGDWFRNDGKLTTLLTTTSTRANARLAPLYGATAPAGASTTAAQMALDPKRRAGVLTQLAFLATHADPDASKPVSRGKVVYERLLCGEVPLPPIEIPEPKPASATTTTRQRYAEHAENACAKACHGLMDPLGFAFEHYDGSGAYRATENGQPVDATGTAQLPTDGDRSFRDAVELAGILAASKDARSCFATQWMRSALGRLEEQHERSSLDGALAAAERKGGDTRELLVGLVTSHAFRHRAATEEVKP